MKTLFLLCGVMMALYCGCDSLKNENSLPLIETEIGDVRYQDYPTHHLLDSDPNRFLGLYRQSVPEASENYLKCLLDNRRLPPSLRRQKELEAEVSLQAKITSNILNGVLQSEQYRHLKMQAQELIGNKKAIHFIALEYFGHDMSPDGGYSYHAMILFETHEGNFLLENITEHTFRLHTFPENIRQLLNELPHEKGIRTFDHYTGLMRGGNIAIFTQSYSSPCRISFLRNFLFVRRDIEQIAETVENNFRHFFGKGAEMLCK